MADDIKRVGIELTAEGAKDFTTSLKEVSAATKEAYSELKLARSQYDKNTSSVKKLEDRQKYLAKATEEYKKKQDLLTAQLKELEDAENRDEVAISKKKAEINQCKAKLGEYEKALKDVNTQLETHSAQLKDWGEKLKTVGGKMTEVGKTLTTHVTAPIVAVGAASVTAWNEVDGAMDTVTTKTGATGDALEDMQQRVKNIAETIPTDFQTAADAVGEVNTRFGVTGDELEELSKQFVEFAEINDTDVSSSIDSVQSAMAAWGVKTEDAGLMLDVLNKAGQDTGISVDKLSDLLSTNKTALEEMGFSVSDAATFLANLDKNGVDTSSTLAGLKKALQNAAKDGKTSKEAFDELQEKMGEGADKSDAYATAIELFGAKAGPAIADAVREGRLSFDELGTSMEDYAGNVGETFDATVDPLDSMTTAMNTAKDLGYEIVEAAAPMIVQALTTLRDVIQGVKEKWDNLSEGQQEMIIKIAGIAAVIGPLLVVLGTVMSTIGGIVSIVGGLLPVIGGVIGVLGGPLTVAIGIAIAAGALLIANWQSIKQWATDLAANVAQKWEELKTAVSTAISNLQAFLSRTWTLIKTTVLNTVESLRQGVVNKFNAARTLVSNIVSGIRTAVENAFNTAKQTVFGAIENIKTTVSEGLGKAKKTVEDIFDNIKKAIGDKLEAAKKVVGEAIEKIKDKFDFKWKLPDLKLPHIRVDNYIDVPVLGRIPDPKSIHVDWYAKAMDDPYMLEGATLFGAMGGSFLGGGEAGREIMVGEQKAMEMISKASGSDKIVVLLKYLISLLEYYLPKRTGQTTNEINRMLGALL